MTEYICKTFGGKTYYFNTSDLTLIDITDAKDVVAGISAGRRLMCVGFQRHDLSISLADMFPIMRGFRVKSRFRYQEFSSDHQEHVTDPIIEIKKFDPKSL